MKGKNFGPLLLCIAIVLLVLNILLLSSVSSLERDLRSMESGMQSRISELRNDNVRLQQLLNSLEENFRASAADVVDVSMRYTGVTEADEVRTALGFTLKESRGGQVLVTAISDTLAACRRLCLQRIPRRCRLRSELRLWAARGGYRPQPRHGCAARVPP